MSADQREFDRIYQQHKSVVASYLRFQIANTADQEEVFQDVWIDVFRSLARSKPQHSRAFVLQIARRKSARFRNRQRNPVALDLTKLMARTERSDVTGALASALQSIDLERREVFLMKHQMGLSYDEIARVLDIPPGTVASRLHAAVEELKASLKRAGFEPRLGETA